MKPILVALVMALLGAGGIFIAYNAQNEPVSYEKETKIETVEIAVDPLLKLISEAQAARKADIETTAKAAYDNSVKQALLDIEIEVRDAYSTKLEAENKELKAQSKSY